MRLIQLWGVALGVEDDLTYLFVINFFLFIKKYL